MKARRMSVCSLCPDMIHIGQPIARAEQDGWAHAECVIMARDGRWADAYRVPEPDRKAELAAWLRTHSQLMGCP